jgi:CBS domain-containing protein
MTCQEVMTVDPVCCVPDDAVAEVAKLMRAQDVGSVPVVEDHDGRRLIGMLTDRDLTVRVIAEGRDPAETQVREVMSNNPVACQASDVYQEALRAMGEHQLRRIPVVDGDGRLAGIIAQADVATRLAEPSTTGAIVEAISEPAATPQAG